MHNYRYCRENRRNPCAPSGQAGAGPSHRRRAGARSDRSVPASPAPQVALNLALDQEIPSAPDAAKQDEAARCDARRPGRNPGPQVPGPSRPKSAWGRADGRRRSCSWPGRGSPTISEIVEARRSPGHVLPLLRVQNEMLTALGNRYHRPVPGRLRNAVDGCPATAGAAANLDPRQRQTYVETFRARHRLRQPSPPRSFQPGQETRLPAQLRDIIERGIAAARLDDQPGSWPLLIYAGVHGATDETHRGSARRLRGASRGRSPTAACAYSARPGRAARPASAGPASGRRNALDAGKVAAACHVLEAGRLEQAAHRLGTVPAVLHPQRAARRAARGALRDAGRSPSPSAPSVSAPRARSARRPVAGADRRWPRRAGWRRSARKPSPAGTASNQLPSTKRTEAASSRGVAGGRPARPDSVAGHHARVAPGQRDRDRDRAAAGAQVQHRRRGLAFQALQRGFDQHLGIRTRNQHVSVTRKRWPMNSRRPTR